MCEISIIILIAENWCRSDPYNKKLSRLCLIQLVLVLTCLRGRFGINCPCAFLKILKLPK